MEPRYKARCEKLRARAEEQGNLEAVKEFTRRLNPGKTDDELFPSPAEKDGAAPAAAPSARRRKTAKKKTARRRK